MRTPEQNRERVLKWQRANRDKANAKRKRWGLRNPDRLKAIVSRTKAKNIGKIRAAARRKSAEVRKLKPWVKRAHEAERRARLKHAMPEWVDRAAIKEFYRDCPDGLTVDHIVPLIHPLVCGLHILANLQYLTASENSSKRNTFDVA